MHVAMQKYLKEKKEKKGGVKDGQVF